MKEMEIHLHIWRNNKSATMIHSPGASLPPPKRSIGCVEMMSAATTVQGNPVMPIVADFRVAVPDYVTYERRIEQH